MGNLTHVNSKGKAVMVDIGEKQVQKRSARARGFIKMAPATIRLIKENQLKKGDVLVVAQLAGICAAKETGSLIPLCHNISLESIDVVLKPGSDCVIAESEIKCTGKTGVEMEALTSVAVALLAVYDMCKAVDKNMVINGIELIEKTKK